VPLITVYSFCTPYPGTKHIVKILSAIAVLLLPLVSPPALAWWCRSEEDIPWQAIESLIQEIEHKIPDAGSLRIEKQCFIRDTQGEDAYKPPSWLQANIVFQPVSSSHEFYIRNYAYCRTQSDLHAWSCDYSTNRVLAVGNPTRWIGLDDEITLDQAKKVLEAVAKITRKQAQSILEIHEQFSLPYNYLQEIKTIYLDEDGSIGAEVEHIGCDGPDLYFKEIDCGLENCAIEIKGFCSHIALCVRA